MGPPSSGPALPSRLTAALLSLASMAAGSIVRSPPPSLSCLRSRLSSGGLQISDMSGSLGGWGVGGWGPAVCWCQEQSGKIAITEKAGGSTRIVLLSKKGLVLFGAMLLQLTWLVPVLAPPAGAWRDGMGAFQLSLEMGLGRILAPPLCTLCLILLEKNNNSNSDIPCWPWNPEWTG